MHGRNLVPWRFGCSSDLLLGGRFQYIAQIHRVIRHGTLSMGRTCSVSQENFGALRFARMAAQLLQTLLNSPDLTPNFLQ